jgi:hypothetical protein
MLGLPNQRHRISDSWETIDPIDPEFVLQFERGGKGVRVAEGEKGTVDLDIIPALR